MRGGNSGYLLFVLYPKADFGTVSLITGKAAATVSELLKEE
jgi:hypothetical protein